MKWIAALAIPLLLLPGCKSEEVKGEAVIDHQVESFFSDLEEHGFTIKNSKSVLDYSDQICPALSDVGVEDLVAEILWDSPDVFGTEQRAREYFFIVVNNFCPDKDLT